jgi:hypothetical protein
LLIIGAGLVGCELADDFATGGARVTLLPDTDAAWRNPDWPDAWVPAPFYAALPLSQQYARAFFFAVQITTGVGDNVVPRSALEVSSWIACNSR